MNTEDKLVIYQAADGAIELPVDAKLETIWASQRQIAEVFGVDRSRVTRHINNILKDGEVKKKSNVRKAHFANSDKPVSLYSLDIILAVGYRTSSSKAINFRKWATTTLKQYITSGFVIDKKRIEYNNAQFLRALSDLKLLSENVGQVGSSEATDLALAFATTWLSLDAYDKSALPSSGTIKKAVDIGASDLEAELHKLRKTLIAKGEATDIFATERTKGGLHALFGNVFQSFAGEDVYPTAEEKAAHLLYFVVKNHVFVDGNKRSGAYAFVWFLQKPAYLTSMRSAPKPSPPLHY